MKKQPPAYISDLRMVTLFALITMQLVIRFESITVPAVVIVAGPVYAVNAVPAGTPVLLASGKAAGLLVGLGVADGLGVGVGMTVGLGVGVADALGLEVEVALGDGAAELRLSTFDSIRSRRQSV